MRYATKDQHEVTRYRLLQITPAAPGTYALYALSGPDAQPTGELWRLPAPAWGLWVARTDILDSDRHLVACNARVVREAGPLVISNGGLVPADSLSDFRGIRVGDFVSTIVDHEGHDDPTKDLDPAGQRPPIDPA